MSHFWDEDDNTLCGRCGRIELPAADSQEDWSFRLASMQDVMASATTGCRFCMMITMGLDLDAVPLDQGNYVQLEIKGSEGALICCSSHKASGERLEISYFNFNFFNSAPSLSRPFEIARQWLSGCVKHHGCVPQSEAALPTRVLDLTALASGYIRLHVPSLDTKEHYAALSYCWGAGESYTTTSTTMLQHMDKIPIGKLPKTIQDAIRITAELNVRYLWVDALCILQGQDEASRNDWKQESAKMESVYGGAYVTIVAASARRSDRGIIFPRSCQLVSVGNIAGTKGLVMVKQRPSAMDTFGDDPIHTRAWALQENLLSQRLLICRHGELIWQCDVRMLSESDTEPNNYLLDPIYRYRLLKDKVTWDPIVDNFCRRNLAYDSDKLPAIAGLARKYHNVTGDRYLAGLWERDFLAQLLWTTQYRLGSFAVRSGRPAEYRAPSWSWASVTGPIRSRRHTSDKMLCTLLECKVDLVDSADPFGMVSGGYIRITGPLTRVDSPEFDEKYNLYVRVSGLWQPDDRTSRRRIGDGILDEGVIQGIEIVNGSDGFYLLRVAISSFYAYSLMLVALRERSGVFQRIGLITLWEPERAWFDNAQEQTITII
jgi:hypothetical protein